MTQPAERPAMTPERIEQLERVLLAFVQQPNWPSFADAAPPEDNPEWRSGYEGALSNLREELKPWWPFGGALDLTRPAAVPEQDNSSR